MVVGLRRCGDQWRFPFRDMDSGGAGGYGRLARQRWKYETQARMEPANTRSGGHRSRGCASAWRSPAEALRQRASIHEEKAGTEVGGLSGQGSDATALSRRRDALAGVATRSISWRAAE